MSPLQKKRCLLVIFLITGVSLTLFLILYALSQNINLFYTPSQLNEAVRAKTIRVGGMVVKGSIVRQKLNVEFVITDFNQQLKVFYQGILPDLFKEGQGVVALGKLNETGNFIAEQVLAKHDEKYMPPEIAALKGAQ